MDEVIHKQLKEVLDKLHTIEGDRRDHFARLLIHLSRCYFDDDESYGVLLVRHSDTQVMAFSAGADEMECMELLQQATEVMAELAVADAPPREMFN
jgi:hypothetical protein